MEPWKWPNSKKEGTAANQTKLWVGGWQVWNPMPGRTSCGLSLSLVVAEYPLKSTLPLVICIHNINSSVGCMVSFTCERCNMSSMMVAALKIEVNFNSLLSSLKYRCSFLFLTLLAFGSTSRWTDEVANPGRPTDPRSWKHLERKCCLEWSWAALC